MIPSKIPAIAANGHLDWWNEEFVPNIRAIWGAKAKPLERQVSHFTFIHHVLFRGKSDTNFSTQRLFLSRIYASRRSKYQFAGRLSATSNDLLCEYISPVHTS